MVTIFGCDIWNLSIGLWREVKSNHSQDTARVCSESEFVNALLPTTYKYIYDEM